jgi:hypothetical protein
MEAWMGGEGAKSAMACMATSARARTDVRRGNAAARIEEYVLLGVLLLSLGVAVCLQGRRRWGVEETRRMANEGEERRKGGCWSWSAW